MGNRELLDVAKGALVVLHGRIGILVAVGRVARVGGVCGSRRRLVRWNREMGIGVGRSGSRPLGKREP